MNPRRLNPLITLCATLLSCAIPSACSRRSEPSPNLDSLKERLKQTAERKLAAPALANEHLVITDAPENIEARAQEVIDAAIQAGGTAIKTTNSDGSVLVIAQVPTINAELFRGLVRKERVTRDNPERSGEMRIIEISIKPQASGQTEQPPAAEPSP